MLIATCISGVHPSPQPNPPEWPTTYVKVYPNGTPASSIESDFATAFASNGGDNDNGQFVNQGYAFLFAPGATVYDIDVNIGYYPSVMGMGVLPDETVITDITSPSSGGIVNGSALNTFWRSAENFKTTPTITWGSGPGLFNTMTWAVSQASPLRRIHIEGSLALFRYEESSGGFMADCKVTNRNPQVAIQSGSQQQWLSRNVEISSPPGQDRWSNGVWNMVFLGCIGAPESRCRNCPGEEVWPCSCLNCYTNTPPCTTTCIGNPYTNVSSTPIIAEKPYIVSNSTATLFSLAVPPIETNKVGISTWTNPTHVPFTQVYVATPTDSADAMNTQVTEGNHIILTPGIYHLTDSILVNQDNLVVLGIGYPILISTIGKPCIVIGNQSGVRIGGILLQAGPSTDPVTPTLLRWGTSEGSSLVASGFLYDCFARVGRFSGRGSEPLNQTELMVEINSANVVCDNLWLWRADHDSLGVVFNENNRCNRAMEVNGNHVTAYGLACEHTLQDITVWNGNDGRCYFYQAEFPYDVTSSYGTSGYVGYRVNPLAVNHLGVGLGIYCNFRDYTVTVDTAISALGAGVQMTNCLTRFLNNNGGIFSVLNGVYGSNTTLANTAAVNQHFRGLPIFVSLVCHF